MREKVEKPRITVFFPRAFERRALLIVGVCDTSSYLHIFTSSHLHIFTSSHLHIFTSSHLHTFTSSHPSHLHIFTSHPHIFTFSHFRIFSSSHLHIFTSSDLLSFASSHLRIFTSSHLLIFSSSHLHILTSSHLPIFSLSLALLPSFSCFLPSCPLLSPSFSFSLLRRGAVPTRHHQMQPFLHETRFDRQKPR